MDKIKEFVINEKKNIIIAIVLLVAFLIAYDVLREPDNRQRIEQTRDNLQSVGTEQQRAGQAVTESKRIVTEIRTTNQSITREIDTSRELNKSSAELITEGKSIIRSVRARN